MLILGGAVLVVFLGKVELAFYPPFATFHAGFVFFVDMMTAYLFFGQFAYRRRLFYLVLGSAFLFSSLTMIPFLLSFPGALISDKPLIGGAQSSIWIWHFWHSFFPAIIAFALLFRLRNASPVPVHRVKQAIASVSVAVGRVDSMFATSALLVVFVSDINRLYRLLAEAMRELFQANSRLSGMVEEKDGLLAELRASEEQILRMAYRDAVTNLPNRRSLMESLYHTLAQAKRHGHTTALLFVDLDR